MTRLLLVLSILATIGCSQQQTEASLRRSTNETIVVGKVIDIHLLGSKQEQVTICHFDPRYVIALQTDNGQTNLAIHSPTQAFTGSNPIGKVYSFCLKRNGNLFLLLKATETALTSR